jgi:hypothetical protein
LNSKGTDAARAAMNDHDLAALYPQVIVDPL